METTDDVAVANRLLRASVTYTEGQHVVVGANDYGDLIFGKIETFVSLQNTSDWLLVCRNWKLSILIYSFIVLLWKTFNHLN